MAVVEKTLNKSDAENQLVCISSNTGDWFSNGSIALSKSWLNKVDIRVD